MSSIERLKEEVRVKQQIESVASDMWCGEVDTDTLRQIDSPWALYEIASKTQFRYTDEILGVFTDSQCDTCSQCCIELIESQEHMPPEIFLSDSCCLLEWKQQMRVNHSFYEAPIRQLDLTMTILKPGRDKNTRRALDSLAGESTIIAEREMMLDPADIAFLYTSAYGQDFMRDLMDYMKSDTVQILLLNIPDIGKHQDELKRNLRSLLDCPDPMRNNVHFPDSFHEALAQATYFFPEESNLYVRA